MFTPKERACMYNPSMFNRYQYTGQKITFNVFELFQYVVWGGLCIPFINYINDLLHRRLFRQGLRSEAMDFIALPFTDKFSHCRILRHD